MTLLWIAVFIASLFLMVKGADWFLESAEKIGFAIGLSPFIIGVVIVGLGTSFPELISSLAAVFTGEVEIVAANAMGSNIANILLVVGISAIVGKKLVMTKSLIDLDIPLLVTATLLFAFSAYDGVIVFLESLLLVCAFTVYLLYSIFHKDDLMEVDELVEVLPSRHDRRKKVKLDKSEEYSLGMKHLFFLLVGIASLVVGAKYLIDSVVALSQIFNVATGAIALVAVAVGTSLPELLVSVKAALQKKSELALGNIFGSNVFNLLFVVGVPGLITTLHIDAQTLVLGLPVLLAATFIFIISGISRRVHGWEGGLYVLFYIFFVGKLFGLI